MELQAPMIHQNPYDIVKTEQPPTPPKPLLKSSYLDNTAEMVFSNFQLHNNFCQLSDPLNNNNHQKTNSNGRALAADRKRPYPCSLCTSKFGSKMELEEHQNSHTGQKPFECDVCKARFNRRSTLWNHKRIHSDAKPFVCTVCQMTFKWKNSLKCHKDMHQRKNETSSHLDNDLRQLTYATAAKRKLQMEQEENGIVPATSTSSSIHNNPLITTTSGNKKKTIKTGFKPKSVSSTPSLNGVHLGSVQPLQASSLIPPSDHQLDLDTSSLDTLMHNQSQSILMQLYQENPNGMLSNLDESTTALNMPLPMQINMNSFPRLSTLQQHLPSVHHIASTPVSSVSSSMEYNVQHENTHAQYIVQPQTDMMLNQQVPYQTPIDNCVLLANAQDYNGFDYSALNHQYQMAENLHHREIRDEKELTYDQW